MQTEAVVIEQPKPAIPESHIHVVDSTNYREYVRESLGLEKEPTPEEKAAAELVKVEAEKAERLKTQADDEDPTHDLGESVPKDRKDKLNDRFKELTTKRRTAEEAAQRAADEAKALKDELAQERAERERLKAQYEPPKADMPEPKPEDFTDAVEYGKALKDWTTDNVRKQDAANASQAALKQAWDERTTRAKAAIADYAETLSASDVKVSDVVRDAIMESDNGPEILYHLAKNPDIAAGLAKMSAIKAVAAIGKLDATVAPKAEAKQEAKTPIAELSKAPEPITPIRAASSPAPSLRGSDPVPAGMSYDQWAELYKAGRIK